MNRYKATVTLEVNIDAFDETDARLALADTFGPGEECGIDIKNSEVTHFEPA